MYRPKLSTKQKIYWYLKNNGTSSGGKLEMMADEWETKPSVISRRARELAKAGIIYRSLSERGTVKYSLHRALEPSEANRLLKELKKEQGVLNV